MKTFSFITCLNVPYEYEHVTLNTFLSDTHILETFINAFSIDYILSAITFLISFNAE